MCRRYEGFGRLCKQINPQSDLNGFIKTLNIPDSIPINKHVFSAPPGAAHMAPQQLQQV